MLDFPSFHLTGWQWALLALCAVMVGIAKTGIPGFGTLVVPLAAIAVGAKTSVGIVLPMLIIADVFAIAYHRRNALWGHILRLVPIALIGIVAGWSVSDRLDDAVMKRVIGLIVLAMVVLRYAQKRWLAAETQNALPQSRIFAVVMGFLAGLTTMLANAAGPVMNLYLLTVRLPKMQFVGTAAWFFFIVNWLKVPFQWDVGGITPETLRLNALLAAPIVLGAIIGIIALKRIPQRAFNVIIEVLTIAAAAKLLV